MFKVVRKSTPNSFLSILKKRRSEWSAVGKIAARIVVPDDLRWWYWQEFGTAIGGRSGNVDETGGASGSKYPIVPTGPGYPLRFPDGAGGEVVTWKVQHPGVPSHHFVTRTLPENLQLASIKIIAAMDRSQWNVATVRDSLMNEVMPRVKENIVSMISITLTGTRDDGKLFGQTAASDFDERANIRDSSSNSSGGDSGTSARTASPEINILTRKPSQLERTPGTSQHQEYQRSLKSARLRQYFRDHPRPSKKR